MLVGPPKIHNVMTSLENNGFVLHFLLGNKMINPISTKSIS